MQGLSEIIFFKKYSVENCLSAGMDFVNGIFLFINIVRLPKWPVETVNLTIHISNFLCTLLLYTVSKTQNQFSDPEDLTLSELYF